MNNYMSPQAPMDIYVLGIHDGHNSGAAILKNGKVLAAVNEERLTNIKNDSSIPFFALAKVFDITGIKPENINIVAVASKYRIVTNCDTEKQSFIFRMHQKIAPFFHGKRFTGIMVNLLSHLTDRTGLFEALNIIGIKNIPVIYVEHHSGHAATAFYSRPWKEKTLIFTLDGMGDGISATVSIGEKTGIRRIASTSYFDSLGANVYSEITRFLGMRRNEHEYKVMGLAPYGNPEITSSLFTEIFRLNPQNRLEFENRTRLYLESFENYYSDNFRYKRFDHVAAGVQQFFEKIVVAWVREGIKQTGIRNICVAGGSFLNIKTNMLINQLPEVVKFFAYPAADDGGLPVGAALSAYYNYCHDNKITPAISPINSVYYGEEFSNDQIFEFLKSKKLLKKIRRVSSEDIAGLLFSKKIIARLSGRDEWGPRALGNRSILADPGHAEITQRLNSAIKHRDFWMPFAPAILKEDQDKYVKKSVFSPYMTLAFETTPYASEIPAVIHPADKTTRPMTVNDWNKPFQEIVRSFRKKSGIGAILNTSFNLHGYPVVSTPAQALWTFNNSGLDGLLLEDYYIARK